MGFLSALWGGVITVTASIIAAVTVHVPFLMNAPANAPTVVSTSPAVATTSAAKVVQKPKTPYVPMPIDGSFMSTTSGRFTEDRSPDGNYISHTYDSEGGDAGIYLTDSKGEKVTKTYCGYFREWAPDGKSVEVFVPYVCGDNVSEDENFELHVDGTVSNSTDSSLQTKGPTPLASTTEIHVPVDSSILLEGTNSAPGTPPEKGSKTVNIVLSKEESGTGMYGDAYLDGKQIATGVPAYSSLEGSSPDGTYYAYRSFAHASAFSSFIGIQIFNVHTGEHSSIETPPGENASKYVSNPSNIGWYDVMSYIESYAWQDDSSINFVFYYLAWADPAERVSSRQVWNYNIPTKQFLLVSTST